MAASRYQTKIVTPFMPSLLHCTAVKIAVTLFQEFGVETLEGAFNEIQQGNLSVSEVSSNESSKAKENLLFIPPHLRQNVMEAVHGSHEAALEWISHHRIFEEEKCNFHWRSDGSFDVIKTAQSLVQNTKFHIKDRFHLALSNFLKERGPLWKEFEKQSGSLPGRSLTLRPTFPVRYSPIYNETRPDEMHRDFHLLEFPLFDDLRFCLYSLTKEEEEQMLLQIGPYRLLRLHLMWPLQTLFLQTVAKLWNYIDNDCFKALLSDIFHFNEKLKDFSYSELLESFWDASPLHLRERAREVPELKQRIDSYFDEKGRRTKFIDHGQTQKFN